MTKKYRFKLLPYDIVLRSIPYMGEKKVSKISRGIDQSTQTNGGFVQNWVAMRGDPKILDTKNGYAEQTWGMRRNSFIRRHMKQIKLNNEPLFENGSPTRRHLSLIAWGYSPSLSRLKKWAKNQPSPYTRVYRMYIG